MTDEVDRSFENESPPRTPVNAFSVLANELRITVMRELWEASEPLSFSEIADRAGIRDTGNFNYHLGKLRDCFVAKTDDDRYTLTRAGRNAMTAVLVGTMTESPGLNRARIDHRCPYCETSMEICYGSDETLRLLCQECSGTFRGANISEYETRDNPERTVSVLDLPPSGMDRDSPTEIAEVAVGWTMSRAWAALSGTCPDCAGRTSRSIHVCSEHDVEPDICPVCDARFAVLFEQRCEHCHTGCQGAGFVEVLRDSRVRRWFLDHGCDLAMFHPEDWLEVFPHTETVHAVDPLDYELRWVSGGDELVVRADQTLSVANTARRRSSADCHE